MSSTRESNEAADHNFVVVASRLPVDRVEGPDGRAEWQRSPGGLVTALEPVMREAGGAWIGWSGDAGPAPGAFEADGLHLVGLSLSEAEVRNFYEGFCNATLWPLYHDVIAPPQFHRRWWEAYVTVNRRFAQAAAEQAAPGATVWVHDYQLQLVPRMLREQRDDVRIGFFNHIPFPGYEIFAQLPWRRQVVEGLLGADLLGFQRRADATNFLRACRRAVGLTTRGSTVRVRRAGRLAGDPGGRVPDLDRREGPGRDRPAGRRRQAVRARSARRWASRAWCCWAWTGSTTPRASCTGCGPTESWSTRGGWARGRCWSRWPARAGSGSRPTRRSARRSRGQSAGSTASTARWATPPSTTCTSPIPREEMAALYLAADVMLVTPLRDGMNLVAKEYVACRNDESGTLVLSEFTGAADELAGAFLVNPHDIEGMKNAIVRAATATSPAEARRRMRAMRKRVREHDVARWAASFLDSLRGGDGTASVGGLDRPGQLTSSGGPVRAIGGSGRSSGSGRAGRSRPSWSARRRRRRAGAGAGAGSAVRDRGCRRGGGLVGSLRVVLADVQVEDRLGGVPEPAERAGVAGHVILLVRRALPGRPGPGWPG